MLGCCPFIDSSGSVNEVKIKLLNIKIRKKAFIRSREKEKIS